MEDLGGLAHLLAHVDPVLEIIAHMIADEGPHGHGIAADHAHGAGGGSGGLRGHDGAYEHAVVPIAGLIDQGRALGAAAAEDDGRQGHSIGILPVIRDAGAILRGRGKAGIGMGDLGVGAVIMRLAGPVQQALGRLLGETLPPDGLVDGIQRHIGEDRIASGAGQSIGIAVGIGAGGNAEEAGLRVDGIELAVLANTQPCNIVAQRPDMITLLGKIIRGGHHGQIGLAAGGGESCRHIFLLSIGIFDAEDQHMLSHPAFVFALEGRDAQRKALFAQQNVSAVAGVDGPDGVVLGELEDIALVGVQGALAVETADEIIGIAQLVQHLLAHAGHDGHADDHIDGVGDLDAHLGKAGSHRAHAEGDHIHGPPLHGAAQHIGSHLIGLLRIHPVVGGTAVRLIAGADKCAALHTSHIVQRRTVIVAARELLLVQLDQFSGGHGLPAQTLQLFLAAVDPDDTIGASQLFGVLNKLQDGFVRGQGHK